VLAQEPWEILSFPAIAEADERHEIETIWGPQCFTRRQGEALHPEREPLATLERIRRTIGEYNFAGQYQQSPAPLGGGPVKAEWFKRYDDTERPERFDRIVQSWDTANKATELSNFSVCTTWGVCGKKVYLLGLLRQRLEYPALKRAVREQQNLFNANVVLIEDKASGTQLIQELIADGCHGVTRYQPTTDKIMRMHAQTAMIANAFVHIPQSASWVAEYLHEMTVFPNGKHDDPFDSTAQFLEWFQKPFPGQNIFEYYRQGAEKVTSQREPEKRKPPRPVNVRIEAPPGIGAAQTFWGRHINVGPDGIVEMSEEDAFYFIQRAGPYSATQPDVPACQTNRPSVASVREIFAAYRPVLRDRPSLILIVAAALENTGVNAMWTYYGAFYLQRHGFNIEQVGWVSLAAGFGVFLGQIAAGTRLGERPHALFIGGCAGSGSLIGLSVMLGLPATAAMALMATGWLLHGLTMVSAVVLLVGQSPAGRATILTLYGSAMSLGMALGAVFGGVALAVADYFALGVCTMALPIASAILVSFSRLNRPGAA